MKQWMDQWTAGGWWADGLWMERQVGQGGWMEEVDGVMSGWIRRMNSEKCQFISVVGIKDRQNNGQMDVGDVTLVLVWGFIWTN